jgi:hypothetical protein
MVELTDLQSDHIKLSAGINLVSCFNLSREQCRRTISGNFVYCWLHSNWIALHYWAICRSQWSCGLKTVAQILGSWDRMKLEAWMSACLCSVFVLSCVGSGPATGCSPVQGESYRLCIILRNWSETKRFADALCSRRSNRKYDWISGQYAIVQINRFKSILQVVRLQTIMVHEVD